LAETQAGGCGGLCVEGVVGVDPCADAWFAGDFGEEGQCEGGSAGGFRSGEFADGADREATVEQSIYLGDAVGAVSRKVRGWGVKRGWKRRSRESSICLRRTEAEALFRLFFAIHGAK